MKRYVIEGLNDHGVKELYGDKKHIGYLAMGAGWRTEDAAIEALNNYKAQGPEYERYAQQAKMQVIER